MLKLFKKVMAWGLDGANNNGAAHVPGTENAGHKKVGSKNLAKSRLQVVLVQDRSGLTADEMTNFRQEMLSVIEKYFVVDSSGFDVSYQRDRDLTTLLINSPVLVRRRTDNKDSKKKSLDKKVETIKDNSSAAATPQKEQCEGAKGEDSSPESSKTAKVVEESPAK